MEEKIKHLEMIQNIIQRLSSNSFYIKGWTIALVIAEFSVTINYLFMVSLVTIFVFWVLDSYYLLLERKYVILYDEIRNKEGQIDFNLNVTNITYELTGNKKVSGINCFLSLSELGYYLSLGLMTFVYCL